MAESEENYTLFKGTIQKQLYNNESFKIYSSTVDEIISGKEIQKHPVYNNMTFKGNVQDLYINNQYEILVEYKGKSKFGAEYIVHRASIEEPTTEEQVLSFLNGLCSKERAKALVTAYPDIIERISQGKEIDTSKISGVGEKTLEKIKKKVLENIAILPLQKDFDLPNDVLRKMLNKYGSPECVRQEIIKNPYEAFLQVKGIGIIKADENSLKVNPSLINSKQRLKSFVTYYLKDNESNGNTYMDINELYNNCEAYAKESIEHFKEVVELKEFWYSRETKRIARRQTREMEEYIAKSLVKMNKNVDKWEVDIEKYRKVDDGISLSDEQIEVLNSLCNHKLTILTGFAGCGKSQSIASCIRLLKDLNKSFLLMTPTAKSSDVLADFTHENARTVHRHLGSQGEKFTKNQTNKLETDVIIFDEFSMCDIKLFYSLLLATHLDTTRIIFVGDSSQLPSIQMGNLLHDLTTSGVINNVSLTKVFRYGDGGLMKVVTDVRGCEEFLPRTFTGTKVFGKSQDFCYIEVDQEIMVQKAKQVYQKLLDNGHKVEDILVVTSKNVSNFGTKYINTQVQQMIHQNNKEYININSNFKLYLGDKVKQKVNNYKIPSLNCGREVLDEVYNGQTGIVTKLNEDYIHVKIKDKEFIYGRDKITEQLDLGYALTVYSAQGMSVDFVISLIPKADTFLLNSNNIYTAWTRARKRCYVLGNIKTINNVIRRKINLQRNTFTKELLIHYAKN